jgi:hypothetical protein
MTAADLLERLNEKGVVARADGPTLRLRPADRLTPEEISELRAHKPALLQLLGYHAALRQWWHLTALGSAADHAECRAVLDDLARRIDEVGVALADTLRARWGRAWHLETGRCPWCGIPGDYHEVTP